MQELQKLQYECACVHVDRLFRRASAKRPDCSRVRPAELRVNFRPSEGNASAARIPRDEITAVAIYRSTGRSSIYLIMVNESPRGGGCTGTTATIWEKLLETRGELYARAMRFCALRTYRPEAASIPIHFRGGRTHSKTTNSRRARAPS